jgi:SAM-dependent methyltransferase
MRIYLFGLLCGVRCLLRGALGQGLKFLIAPVGYWRLVPFTLLEREFHACRAKRVLDVSSPKLMSLRFAALGAQVVATDLDDPAIFRRWLPAAKTLKLDKYSAAFADACRLPYMENSFDLAYSISVVEHIPGDGDAVAVREMLRVVRPGGRVIIEVPFRLQSREIFRSHDSKGAPVPEPMFYERWYDWKMVEERLTGQGRCSATALGETLPIDPWISGERRLPRIARLLLLPLEPLFALCNYGRSRRRPLAMYLVFQK